ncbi:endolytic transglycosylase MltG, partial [Vibrio parahaemolyticus]
TGSSSATEVFEVPSGASFVKITKQLFEKRLILEEWKFRVFAKFTGQESKVKKGEYLLNHGMNPQAILDAISSGKSIQYPITIP